MSGIRIVGTILAVLGVLAAVFPQWFGPLTGGSEPPADLFHAVERRIRGGMLLGVGLACFAITSLRPWSTSLPLAAFYFATGALAARVLGLIVDGSESKQWLMVAIEGVIMTAASLWLWYSSSNAAGGQASPAPSDAVESSAAKSES